jgi:hypothetical protein
LKTKFHLAIFKAAKPSKEMKQRLVISRMASNRENTKTSSDTQFTVEMSVDIIFILDYT